MPRPKRLAGKSNHRLPGTQTSPPNGDADWKLPENPGDDFLTGSEWITIAGLARLTTREMVVATLLLKGRTRKGIAYRLKLSPETVRVHIDRLFEKFHVQDRLGFALRIARLRESIQAQPWADGAAKNQPTRPGDRT